MKRRFASILLFAGVCAGCSNQPSERDGRAVLAADIDGGAGQRLLVTAFQKTDGQAAEFAGVKAYTMRFTAVAQFADDAFWYRSDGNPFLGSETNVITTFPSTSRYPGCNNDQPCYFVGPSPQRVSKGTTLQMAGSVDFQKSEAGWHATKIIFNTSSGGSVRASGSADAAPAATTGNPPSNSNVTARVDSTTSVRCAKQFAAHPLPKGPWYNRILGKTLSAAKSLPDSELTLSTDKTYGTLALLVTGEVCVGSLQALFLPEFRNPNGVHFEPAQMRLILSRPNSKGYRLLRAAWNDLAQGVWVVHPDSTHLLSDNLSGAKERNTYRAFEPPLPNSWSIDGQFLAIRSFSGESPIMTGILAVAIPNGTSFVVPFPKDIFPQLHPEIACQGMTGGIHVDIDAKSFEWIAPDVVRLRAHIVNWPCASSDSTAIVNVDLTRRVASRTR